MQVASSPGRDGRDDGVLPYVVGAIAVVLLAATWGGWLIYRRRLP